MFSVLRKPPPPRLSGMLEGEPGFNDPPAVLIAGEIAWQLAAGAAIGVAAGVVGVEVVVVT